MGTFVDRHAEIVSDTYFPVLGVRPHLGRLIAESDDLQRDAHPVVVLADDYWTVAVSGREPRPMRALRRVIAGQLFGVAPADVPTMAVATVLLAAVGLAAAVVPAWRASSGSLTEALHAE